MTDSPKPVRHRTSFGYADSLGALNGNSIGHLHERDPLTTATARATTTATAWPGEKLLLAAVLDQAMIDARDTADSDHARRQRGAARRWIAGQTYRPPVLFVYVCEVLGLDAGSVRRAVLGTDTPTRRAKNGSRVPRMRAFASRKDRCGSAREAATLAAR